MADMLMPQMGESIAEATISKWLKNVGDTVTKDEIILEISTDKVDSEIPAPESGVITEILYQEGDVVPVKEKIAVIEAGGAAASPKPAATPAPEPAPQAAAKPQAAPQSAPAQHSESDRFYSPLVKSLAEKHGVSLQELDQVAGTGQAGRFTKQDFMNYLDGQGTTQVAP
ncbi:MAG: E3 binding domain-containing protein, partial [Bdellovibrionales bacterium]|nr:E3 binding domain-containing protein [Bdellovibrionales bacterium]